MTVHEGGCLCGAIRYKVEGEPLMSGACYCRDCQIVAGGGCTYGAAYLTDALTVTKGKTQAFVVKADLRQVTEVESLFKATIAKFGHINILINNAGLYESHPIAEVSYEEWGESWKRVIDTNLIVCPIGLI